MRCDRVCLGHTDSHGKGATTRRRRSWGAGRMSRTRAEGALETGCRSGAPRLRTKSSQASGVLSEGVRRHRGLGIDFGGELINCTDELDLRVEEKEELRTVFKSFA